MSDQGQPRPRRAYRRHNWTAAREKLFFAQLAETANVSQAAARAGVTASNAYTRRQLNPAFAARWVAALDEGYARLEMLLIDQSVNGFERVETVVDGDGAVRQVKTVRSFPHRVAMRLLLSHRDTVQRYRAMTAEQASDEETAGRLRAELARVRDRLRDGGNGDG